MGLSLPPLPGLPQVPEVTPPPMNNQPTLGQQAQKGPRAYDVNPVAAVLEALTKVVDAHTQRKVAKKNDAAKRAQYNLELSQKGLYFGDPADIAKDMVTAGIIKPDSKPAEQGAEQENQRGFFGKILEGLSGFGKGVGQAMGVVPEQQQQPPQSAVDQLGMMNQVAQKNNARQTQFQNMQMDTQMQKMQQDQMFMSMMNKWAEDPTQQKDAVGTLGRAGLIQIMPWDAGERIAGQLGWDSKQYAKFQMDLQSVPLAALKQAGERLTSEQRLEAAKGAYEMSKEYPTMALVAYNYQLARISGDMETATKLETILRKAPTAEMLKLNESALDRKSRESIAAQQQSLAMQQFKLDIATQIEKSAGDQFTRGMKLRETAVDEDQKKAATRLMIESLDNVPNITATMGREGMEVMFNDKMIKEIVQSPWFGSDYTSFGTTDSSDEMIKHLQGLSDNTQQAVRKGVLDIFQEWLQDPANPIRNLSPQGGSTPYGPAGMYGQPQQPLPGGLPSFMQPQAPGMLPPPPGGLR